MTYYSDLGSYSDWVVHAREANRLGWDVSAPADAATVRAHVLDAIGPCGPQQPPADVRAESTWEADGLRGEALSWDTGYGPRTEAWVLRPAGNTAPLPGVVALHGHDGFKWYGKEKVADGPTGEALGLDGIRAMYDGRAYANVLASKGFVVLVHDVFTWGSRKFMLSDGAGPIVMSCEAERAGQLDVIARYNSAAALHEDTFIEKYCRLLGTTMAALVANEDRMALSYLRSRPDVSARRVGCVGLSGGGLRSGMLQATSDDVAAAVVVGMMTSYRGLLDHNVGSHTWMLFPDGVPRFADWPHLVGCRPHSPLLVQYDRDDDLFTSEGMRQADEALRAAYKRGGYPTGYTGRFYDGPHKFDRAMQDDAFAWLCDVLSADR